MPYFVYALCDPRDASISYIGITNDVYTRFKQHLSCKDAGIKKIRWVQQLRTETLIPSLKIIETVDTLALAKERETYWIHYYLELGVELENTAKTNLEIPSEIGYVMAHLIDGILLESQTGIPLIKLAEAANTLHISRQYLYELVYSGKVPAVRIFGQLRGLYVKQLDIDRLIRDKKVA